MINLLLTLLLLALIFGLVLWCITLLPLQPPFNRVAQVIVVLMLVVVLLGLLFGGISLPTVNVR